MSNRLFHKAPLFIVTFSILELVSFWKVQGLVGAKSAFFSIAYACGPVIGGLMGLGTLAGLMGMRRIIRYMFLGGSLLPAGSLYLPTLIAAAYWRYPHAWIRAVLPLMCMLAFVVHPVGMHAYVYSLYWLIPVAVYMVGCTGTIATAFGATFVQHAVGSVIWLYAMPTTPDLWHGLIPVVFFERILHAAAMVLIARAMVWATSLTSTRKKGNNEWSTNRCGI